MKNFWICVAAALAPTFALAWGQEGHSIVGELADRNLSAEAHRVIAQDILGPGVSLASVANWADTVAHGSRPDTYGWHFVDIPLAQNSYDQARDCVYRPKEGAPVKDDCVVLAIEQNAAIVGDKTAPRALRRDALKFLVHFVGDIHQPLHTVDEEAGGNGVKVFFPCDQATGKCSTEPNSNLHSVWDGGLFRPPPYYSWGELLDALTVQWVDTGRVSLLLDQCQQPKTQVSCWALEAHAIANKPGYWVPQGAKLGPDYVKMVSQDRDQQLVRAGMRLARLINSLLAP
ncbi:S1/P1 nuclease [Xylophilus sp. GW821-FHT01B05]